MRAVIMVRSPASHQMDWGSAFAAGLRRHGWQVNLSTCPDPCDLLVMWGVRRQDAIARQLASVGEVCILERGYLGDRFAWTSVSFGGGLNGAGEFRGVLSDPERLRRHFPDVLKPWRPRSAMRRALLIGQVPGDMSLAGVDIGAWYRRQLAALRADGWDVLFRPHPLAGRARVDPGAALDVRTHAGELADALTWADLVVTCSSNTGVDAALAGVTAVATDRRSMVWEVTGRDISDIIQPRREDWAARLAWKQWRLEEMQSGECAECVLTIG